MYLLRHAQSVENAVSVVRDSVEGYAEMKAYVKQAFGDKRLAEKIERREWPAQKMIAIAQAARLAIDAYLGDTPSSDYALSAHGMKQARIIGENLADSMPELDVVFCSPFTRAIRTRDVIAEGCSAVQNARQVVDARLIEKQTGAVKKDYWSFFVLNPNEFLKVISIGPQFVFDFQPPGGENSQQVIARVTPFVEELRDHYQGQSLLIVSHKVCIFALMAVLEGRTSRKEYLRLDSPDHQSANGGLTTYAFQFDGSVDRLSFNRRLW